VACRTRWARPLARRLTSARALSLAAVLGVVVATAACTSGSVPHATGSQNAGTGPGTAPGPAITAAQARQVFDRYVAAANAERPDSAGPVLSLVTGVERAVLSTALARHAVTVGSAPSGGSGAYQSSLSVEPGLDRYTYGPPAFFLPETAGYPRFFVASVTRTMRGAKPADGMTTSVGGTPVPVDGPALLLFSQATADAPWLLASASQLPLGLRPPRLAANSAGYIPTVRLSDASLLAPPSDAGPLQAAVADDGPASAATRAVADGPLTTGIYQGARSHVNGMRAPDGDVYQWGLEGSSLPEFALRTAAGGALVFYAMTLNTTVAVPDVINKGNPIHSGPPIPVPLDLRMLLPPKQPDPLVQLSSGQLLSFAAIDPPAGKSKIQVIAIGGGLTSASAT
jgi:hypothetical protein